MITVHHLNNSRSQRILWLLEELEQPYELRRYERDPKTLYAPPALLAVHPLGKSPVITDGEVTVAESGAIIEYLLDKYGAGRLLPAAGTPDRLRYTYWLHFAEGSAMPPLLLKLVFDRVASAPLPWPVSRVARAIAGRVTASFIAPRLKAQLDYMEAELGRNIWFAGAQFTAADVQMSFPLELAVKRAGLDNRRPRIMSFLERIHARAAYQRALARGGPYAL
jgi:glutathione S-transferase